MTDHPAFLRAILGQPADDTPRLVYADWLDEQDDPASARMAKFLRLTTQPPAPMRDKRLQWLATRLPADWLAVVSKLPVENCRGGRNQAGADRPPPVQFEFLCDRRWDELWPTDDPAVRACDRCRENVHYCDSVATARNHARHGRCIAINPGVIRRENDLGLIRRDNDHDPQLMTLGRPSPEHLRPPERCEADRVSAERDRRRARQAKRGES